MVSQSPEVTELEYMLPLCSENALGITTIISRTLRAAKSLSAIAGRLTCRPVQLLSVPPYPCSR
jgi:hypothetical protein